jgi:ParB family chromosome partitioning protein
MAKLGMLKNVKSQTGTRDSRAIALTVKDIPLGDISIKGNVRAKYTNLDELAASIRQHGLLQPITVYADEDSFIVKTGHRRYLACKTLYEEEPEKFHHIRCLISGADDTAIIQLVENVQRVDLSQIDLFNALKELKAQGMTLKQIAEVMGKTEKYVKNLFVGINEITGDKELQAFIDSPAGGTIQDVTETKGISNKQERLDLLEQRKNGTINRADLRKKVRELKSEKPKPEYPLFPQADRIKVRMKVFANLGEIVVFTDKSVSEKQLRSIGEDIRRFFSRNEKYDLEFIAPDTKPEAGKTRRNQT